MLARCQLLIGVLGASTADLAIALGITLANAVGDDHAGRMKSQDGYTGMMGAMGAMDSSAMLQHMREVLGEDGFNRMQEHLQAHRSGALTGDTHLDQMMHTMMDGMMGQIGLMPVPDEHHPTRVPVTPTAGAR
jgi:hypothetical protein